MNKKEHWNYLSELDGPVSWRAAVSVELKISCSNVEQTNSFASMSDNESSSSLLYKYGHILITWAYKEYKFNTCCNHFAMVDDVCSEIEAELNLLGFFLGPILKQLKWCNSRCTYSAFQPFHLWAKWPFAATGCYAPSESDFLLWVLQ